MVSSWSLSGIVGRFILTGDRKKYLSAEARSKYHLRHRRPAPLRSDGLRSLAALDSTAEAAVPTWRSLLHSRSLIQKGFDYCVVEFWPDLFYGLIGAVGPGAVG